MAGGVEGQVNERRTYDVAVIGAGPIGLELAACLKQTDVDYIHFDAHQIAYTMSWWPRNTNFFSTSERISIAGVPIQNNHQQRITGEDYTAYLRGVVEQYDLHVNTYEPVTAIARGEGEFGLETQPITGGVRRYRARRIVMAIGDMEYPNRLDIPGEDLPHVSHYFHDPHDYFRRRLLIVGGRNSAVEAALRCWRAGAQVAISYRKRWFNEKKVKGWLLPDLQGQIECGTIQFLPNTCPVEIRPGCVDLVTVQEDGAVCGSERRSHPTDFVLLATGFHGDQRLLEMAGVELRGDNRVPVYDPETMETNVPGLYLAGTVAAGIQQNYTLFIENCHVHAAKITAAVTGQRPPRTGDPARNFELPWEQIQAN